MEEDKKQWFVTITWGVEAKDEEEALEKASVGNGQFITEEVERAD